VARTERICADPSALLKLYVHQPDSAAVNAWRRRTRGVLPLTQHGRLEIVNGICLARSRSVISADAQADALASLDEDWEEGRYSEADVPRRATLRRATDISRAHTAAVGCRTLDVIHIAAALELGTPYFATFDRRQQALARTMGLKLVRW